MHRKPTNSGEYFFFQFRLITLRHDTGSWDEAHLKLQRMLPASHKTIMSAMHQNMKHSRSVLTKSQFQFN